MKTIYIYVIFACVLGVSCEEYLNRPPQDSITDQEIRFSQNEMELYCNQFYPSLPGAAVGGYFTGPFFADYSSDNMIPNDYNYNARLSGSITVPQSGGGWSWGSIRGVNYFLNNYSSTEESWNITKQYVGEMYFFRAYFYFNMLKRFGDLPWYNEPLATNDSAQLYAERLPRNIVADSILNDLDKAIDYLPEFGRSAPQRLYQDVALAFKSRVALYEGTWEKYHQGTEFGVENADYDKYFEMSADASQRIMDSGNFSISEGDKESRNYWNLFNQSDLSGNNSVIFWKKFDRSEGLTHNATAILALEGGDCGVSKSLVDSYLCNDGMPISLSSLYKGDDSVMSLIQNRDPRLEQTIFVPGDPRKIMNGDTIVKFTLPDITQPGGTVNITGYHLFKGVNPDDSQHSGGSDVASITFRYGEVLLNYAEAKAELGSLTQSDLDLSINLLRRRVGMPSLNISVGFSDPNWNFPGLSPLLNEVRRERRVELACEGFRFDDLMRWSADHLITRPSYGAKFSQFEGKSFNPPLENIPVSDDGYIFPYKDTPAEDGLPFDQSKNYLDPLPNLELVLNPNLVQNPGY